MTVKIQRIFHSGMEAYSFECPGCEFEHLVPVAYDEDYKAKCQAVGRSDAQWAWNGSLTAPTFNPSLLLKWTHGGQARVCHSFVTAGRIEFLSDSTHHLSGQTVEMIDAEV